MESFCNNPKCVCFIQIEKFRDKLLIPIYSPLAIGRSMEEKEYTRHHYRTKNGSFYFCDVCFEAIDLARRAGGY
jgi:hypothetical protein